MFNLIVKGGPWADGRDTFHVGRMLEFTEQSLVEKFNPEAQLDLDALIQLPTLFVQESFGDEDQIARVGIIIRAHLSGREVVLEYVYDPGVPPIPNRQLQGFGGELGISDFEFQRTHWAIKQSDLFRSLLKNIQPRRTFPTVFRIADPEAIEPSLVSAMMPFHPSFTPVYEALQKTAIAAGLRCRRADDIWENPAVMQDVVSLIDRSRIVVCDCSTRNPNVFYEIGIAHTLGREVVLITQSVEDIPFDLRHLRYVHYLNNGEGLAQLSAKLQQRFISLT